LLTTGLATALLMNSLRRHFLKRSKRKQICDVSTAGQLLWINSFQLQKTKMRSFSINWILFSYQVCCSWGKEFRDTANPWFSWRPRLPHHTKGLFGGQF
jgi:hypothetical protein